MKESLNSYKSGPDEEGFFNIHVADLSLKL